MSAALMLSFCNKFSVILSSVHFWVSVKYTPPTYMYIIHIDLCNLCMLLFLPVTLCYECGMKQMYAFMYNRCID